MSNDKPLPELESKHMKSRHLSCTGKTHAWEIVSRNTLGNRLAVVRWYSSWRQYTLEPEPQCIFNRECLGDICHFLYQVNAHRKAERENERQTAPA